MLFSNILKYLFLLVFFYLSNSYAYQYTLTITDAHHHLAEVEVIFDDVKTKAFSVKLPVWRTGKYQILDLSKNIRKFQVYDQNEKPLTWQKDNKNTWRIFVNTPGIVKVKYQIYANKLHQRVSHIDATHAFLDASGVFIYSESQRDKPLTVKLNVPNDWHTISGMESIGKNQFKANNYDQLVDSPIESGIHVFDSIKVDEQTYEIVVWGKGNYDLQRIKKDIIKFHQQAKNIWHTFPFKRYVYIYHVGDKLRGATEHINSTVIQADHFGFAPDEKYRKIIKTTAHEFIHTWNVKNYRPTGISPYDYDKENYSDLFWMVEGTTSYLAGLMVTRAKIYSVENYLEDLAKGINKYIHKPGRKVMSLAEASFDTWMNDDANRRHNTTVGIYSKGSLVSWLLDKEIRANTNNKKSVDDLQLLLYEKYGGKSSGYSSSDVKNLLFELTGHDFSMFWKDHIEGTKSIDFNELLAFFGLRFESENDQNKLYFGVEIKENKGLAEIKLVNANGSAWQAGLTVGDQLVALNSYKINFENYSQQLENLEANKAYTLHYFHQGQLLKTTISPIKAPAEKLKIVALKSPTAKQKVHFNDWLQHNFNEAFNK
jgi:predicted metalloprotease with PDZ domain